PGVSRAAADVAGDAEANFVFRRVGILVEQRLGHHDHPRRTEAALRAAKLGELLLQRMLDSFDGDDLAAVGHVAALLRAGEAGLVAQRVEEAAPGLELEVTLFTVEGKRDLLHRTASRARCRARRVRTPTISRRYSALARTLLIGRDSSPAARAARSISAGSISRPRSSASAAFARIGV